MEEKLRGIRIKLILTLATIVLTTVIGVSFAYFSINVAGNEEASSIRVLAADLKLTFTDGPGINVVDVYPGWSTTKTFSVRNTGSDTAFYDIQMYNVYSTFVEDELVYTLTSTNGGGSKTQTIMPNNDGLIKAKISIPSGVTQTFTMTITFKELNKPQDNNQSAEYKGIIQILTPYKYTDGVTPQDITLRERILLDNTEAPSASVKSKYVTTTGISYAKSSDYAYNSQYIYEETVNLTSNANRAIGTSISMDASSGLFTVGGTKAASQTFSTDSIGKYTCNSNSYTCTAGNLYKIVEVNGSTVTRAERYVPKVNTSTWNGLGLYQTNVRTEGGEITYFFRGHVVNNYVSFAGAVWRIVRINEDGTIKLIKETYSSQAKFNTSTNNRQYVGYMIGTSADEYSYSNSSNSNMKTVLANYYTQNIASYSDYLAPYPRFCNDRVVQSISGTTVYYDTRRRLQTSKEPSLVCASAGSAEYQTRDTFTMTGDSVGNNLLEYPIGLITADELALAGAVYGKLSTYYIATNTSTSLTMSPYYCTSTNCYMFYTTNKGYVSYSNVTTNAYVRPVINLKSDVLVLGGSGTSNDPYIITQ